MSNKEDMSLLNLANVEALAEELPEVTIKCNSTYHDCYELASSFSGKCWQAVSGGVPGGCCCSYTGRPSDYCCSIFC